MGRGATAASREQQEGTEIRSERDVKTRTGRKAAGSPGSQGRGPSPSLPTSASPVQDRREMKQISVNSFPCVPRRKREGKNLPNDFKRLLKGVLEDSEVFKAKRAPAETEHVCAHGHTDPHA